MAHQHHHNEQGKNLGLAFFLNLAFTVIEFIGGAITNSVAITSDALHDLGDSFSLGIAWFLQKRSSKKANSRFTYGYRRFSLLGALINSLVLIVGSVFIVLEAWQRLQAPEPTDATGMILFSILGLAVNGFAAYKLSAGKSLNEKVFRWHLLEDVLGWAAVLLVSIILLFTDWYWLDPLLSIVITGWVLFHVYQRLLETVNVFLQGSPKDLNLKQVEKTLLQHHQVKSLHHTHLWTLDGEHHVFSAHVKICDVKNLEEVVDLKEKLKKELSEKYGFSHLTLETELEKEHCAMGGSDTD